MDFVHEALRSCVGGVGYATQFLGPSFVPYMCVRTPHEALGTCMRSMRSMH